MISIVNLLFEQEGRRRVVQSADLRRQWALQRMAEARAAAASGRIDQKTLQQKLRYWQKVAAGSVGSPSQAAAGLAPSLTDLKTAGSFF